MPLLAVLLGIFGAAWASFLEVLADRLPRGERPFGRSRCAHCEKTLEPIDLVPVFSWLWLKGRCRNCGMRIPARHLLFEIIVALFFVAALLTLVSPVNVWELLLRLLLISALAVIFLADLRFYIIPDITSVGLFVFLSIAVLATRWFDVPWAGVLPPSHLALLGALFGFSFLAVFAAISRGTWMGWGDVKLAAALGIAFGFPAILLLLSFSFIIGAVVSLLLVGLRLRTMKDLVPFGPFIVLASLPFLFGYTSTLEDFFGISDFLKIL